MDIIELSQKMEADLLESHTRDLFNLKPTTTNENFSPRVTRSQTNKGQKCLLKESDIICQEKGKSGKVDEVEKIFPNRKSKTLHKNLETIYEDPVWKKGNAMLLGTSKVKRSLYLDREFRITSKQKAKLRKIKIKRLGKRIKPFKISDEEFKKRMLRIENFINENDLDDGCGNGDCDVEFKNFDNNEDCNNIKNLKMSANSLNSINEDEELESTFSQ